MRKTKNRRGLRGLVRFEVRCPGEQVHYKYFADQKQGVDAMRKLKKARKGCRAFIG